MLGTGAKTLLAFALGMLLLRVPVAAALNLDVSATVTGCGDGTVQIGEECDGSNFAGESCSTQGFSGGSLSCDFACAIVTTSCNNGGSGGGPIPTPGPSVVTLSGKAYPGSPVYILRDGQMSVTLVADSGGNFQTILTNISSGSYTFSVYAQDIYGVYVLNNYSALSNYPVSVGNNARQRIDYILVAPILAIDQTAAAFNNTATTIADPVIFYGRSTPNAQVAITINSTNPITVQAVADATGAYSYTIPPGTLNIGDHSATAVASLNNLISDPSHPVDFTIGDIPPPITYMLGDFSENLRVNLVDFSIALYWYKQPLTDAFKVLEVRHGNGDGLLNLIDISIIAYYWTG